MRRPATLADAFCAAVLAVSAAGCTGAARPGGAIDPAPPAAVAAELARQAAEPSGQVLYRHYCAACHGRRGRGHGQYYPTALQTQPADLAGMYRAGTLSAQRLSKVIRGGSEAVGKSALCPPWGRVLTDEQVAALVGYVPRLAVLPPAPGTKGGRRPQSAEPPPSTNEEDGGGLEIEIDGG